MGQLGRFSFAVALGQPVGSVIMEVNYIFIYSLEKWDYVLKEKFVTKRHVVPFVDVSMDFSIFIHFLQTKKIVFVQVSFFHFNDGLACPITIKPKVRRLTRNYNNVLARDLRSGPRTKDWSRISENFQASDRTGGSWIPNPCYP